MAETNNIEATSKKDVVENKKTDRKNLKKKSGSDKPGLGAKISKFFKDLKSELKKIVWFGKEQTAKSTGLVLIALVVCSAVISLLDLGFSSLIMWLGKLI
ncbi:MAG: preprotein translocase subunit SecE [Clostridia bacterium]|jgi:preprotein translocase subunit SecE|nr:preprotein translocase subunit SecE [Clostridia bacterium]MBQ7603559.1 preprotein translocase subunit SecE [Clostridia bacterium]